jgi:SNW domain-containing protein 1
MTSVAAGLLRSLPKPKYTGEDEELPSHAQPRGPKVLGAGSLDETQIVVRVSGTTLSFQIVFVILEIV